MLMIYITSINLIECVTYLDNDTLIQQWDLILKVLNCLSKRNLSWHVTRIWKNHDDALKIYHNYIVRECFNREINVFDMRIFDVNENFYIFENKFDGIKTKFTFPSKKDIKDKILFPLWFSFIPLHLSHKAALLRENPYSYQNFLYSCKNYLKFGLVNVENEKIYSEFNKDIFFKLNRCIPDYYLYSQELLHNPNMSYLKYNKGSNFNSFLNTLPEDDISNIIYKYVFF